MIFDLEKGCSMPCTQNSYRRLQQCIGVWEINEVSVKDADKELGKLGVYKYHFNLDQTPSYHHSKGKASKKCSHKNDLEQALRKIGSWITDVANSNNFEEKQKLLSNILPSLVAHWNNNETPQKPYQETPSHLPSPFLINTILQLKGADKLHEKQKGNLNPDQSFNYGESLGNFILKN
ncbi:23624_t:CDS:2 [Entrophospora sp. SA101]|nr:23624_t:CDS:2 [Entrophospora sp. SA101]